MTCTKHVVNMALVLESRLSRDAKVVVKRFTKRPRNRSSRDDEVIGTMWTGEHVTLGRRCAGWQWRRLKVGKIAAIRPRMNVRCAHAVNPTQHTIAYRR